MSSGARPRLPALHHMVTAEGLLSPRSSEPGEPSHAGPHGGKQNTVRTVLRRSPPARNTDRGCGEPIGGTQAAPGETLFLLLAIRAGREPEGRSGHGHGPASPRGSHLHRARPGPQRCLRPSALASLPGAPEAFIPTTSGDLRPSAFSPRRDPALTLRDSLRKPQLLSAAR